MATTQRRITKEGAFNWLYGGHEAPHLILQPGAVVTWIRDAALEEDAGIWKDAAGRLFFGVGLPGCSEEVA